MNVCSQTAERRLRNSASASRPANEAIIDRDGSISRVFAGELPPGMARDLAIATVRKLAVIDAAERLEDLRLSPGNRLEALRGDRAGQHSIRINS